MFYYILKKWRKITVLEILYTLYMHLYFDTFTTRWECTGICQGGDGSTQMQIVYDDANKTLRFQDNKQNCRRIVTWHKYTFILIRYKNRQAKRTGTFWNTHTKKTPLLCRKSWNAILRAWDLYFENSKGGGGGFQTPTPTPPLDPRLNPPNPKFFDYILYTGAAFYGQIVNTI